MGGTKAWPQSFATAYTLFWYLLVILNTTLIIQAPSSSIMWLNWNVQGHKNTGKVVQGGHSVVIDMNTTRQQGNGYSQQTPASSDGEKISTMTTCTDYSTNFYTASIPMMINNKDDGTSYLTTTMRWAVQQTILEENKVNFLFYCYRFKKWKSSNQNGHLFPSNNKKTNKMIGTTTTTTTLLTNSRQRMTQVLGLSEIQLLNILFVQSWLGLWLTQNILIGAKNHKNLSLIAKAYHLPGCWPCHKRQLQKPFLVKIKLVATFLLPIVQGFSFLVQNNLWPPNITKICLQ